MPRDFDMEMIDREIIALCHSGNRNESMKIIVDQVSPFNMPM